MSLILFLVKREPWRTNQGQALNALDPTWRAGAGQPLCDGEVDFEMSATGATGWWWCHACGHCSNAKQVSHHKAQHPANFLAESAELFREKRRAEGIPEQTIEEQLQFVMGAAARYAATVPYEQLTDYVEALARR